jgi:hypothetical protein
VLRLVDSASPPKPALRRIGLHGFEPELERWLLQALAAQWPRAAITFASDADALCRVRQQLWLSANAPPEGTLAPVLWLDGIGTSEAPERLAPSLWRLAAPITAERLVHGIARVLAA